MNLIRANIRPEFMIKESDQHLHHYLMTRILVNPSDPTHPERKQRVLCVRNADYRRFFDCDTKSQIKYLKAMNYESAELIHDPAIKAAKEDDPVAGPVTTQRLSGKTDVNDDLGKAKVPEYYSQTNVAQKVKRNTRKR